MPLSDNTPKEEIFRKNVQLFPKLFDAFALECDNKEIPVVTIKNLQIGFATQKNGGWLSTRRIYKIIRQLSPRYRAVEIKVNGDQIELGIIESNPKGRSYRKSFADHPDLVDVISQEGLDNFKQYWKTIKNQCGVVLNRIAASQ